MLAPGAAGFDLGATAADGGAMGAGGGAPVTLGGRCSIISSASARLLEIPNGASIDITPVAPGAGLATMPHASGNTSWVGHRNPSESPQLTTAGTSICTAGGDRP